MVTCAISGCGNLQRLKGDGKFFLVETARGWQPDHAQPMRTSLLWLCDECSKVYTVHPWRPAGQQIHRKDGRASGVRDLIRLVQPRTKSPASPLPPQTPA